MEQCARGTVLNQYVYNKFLSSRSPDEYLCQVSADDEWPVIGAVLGFPPVAGGDAGRPPQCRSVVAHRLQLLYNDFLRHFETDLEVRKRDELRKRDEQAENVKTDEQAMALFEHVTKFIDEDPESAEAVSNALDAILRTYPSAPDMEDPTMAPSFRFGDLPPTSPPHPIGHDIFADYIGYSAFDDPTPELVAGSSTNPSPEFASDQDNPHTSRPDPSPQISDAKTDDTYDLLRPAMWKDIAGGDTMFRQAQGWKWEGQMVSPSQPWATSTSDVETLTTARTVASTSTSSKPVDAKCGGKRARDDDTDAPTPGVSSVPPLKKVNRRPPNEEARKRDEQAEHVKTEEQAIAFFDPETTLRWQGLVQGPKTNTLQPGQLFNSVGPLVPPSTAQSISAFSISSMGAQITGSNSSRGVQNQGGIMSGSMNLAAMKGVASRSFPTQSADALQIQRLTQEDLISAKRLVNEKKRMAFSCG